MEEETKTHLLSLARKSISYHLTKGKRLIPPKSDADPVLSEKMGVFVTLHKKGALRGCVGYPDPLKPLQEAVADSAYNAAFRDARFIPVTAGELPDIEIEISCLTPPVPVTDYRQIELGRHGIILKKDASRGVFLPSVAVNEGWDIRGTLENLSVKAGFSADAWKEGALSVFEAIVFSEGDGR